MGGGNDDVAGILGQATFHFPAGQPEIEHRDEIKEPFQDGGGKNRTVHRVFPSNEVYREKRRCRITCCAAGEEPVSATEN
jgi:hypothetical protein